MGGDWDDVAEAPAARLARELADVASDLLSQGTVAQVTQRIVNLTLRSVDGCDEAGLCVQEPLSVELDPPSPMIAQLDKLQSELGEGPCRDVLTGADSLYSDDLVEDVRWPRFGPLASELGIRSVVAYRLFAEAETFGALQLFAERPAAFDPIDRAQGLIFAAHAGMALAVATSLAEERGRADHLREALVSRELIGQAQGILMERERITAEQAFDLLRHASQHLNIKLRDIAQELVDTGAVSGDKLGTSARPKLS